MLDAQDLINIANLLKAIRVEGLANEIHWLANCPDTMTHPFKKHLPECYNALISNLNQMPKLLSHPSSYIPIIAKYRLEHNK